MSRRLRLVLFAAAAILLLPAIWRIALSLPAFGQPTGPYGPAVNALGPSLRNVANMVSAVNFDFRAIDTVGEEFMLVSAVTGAVLLLRGSRGENTSDKATRVPGRAQEPRSDAVVLVARLFGPIILLFGLYIVLHATVTPGGGFQGGVVIASGLLLVYLGEGYSHWRRLVPSKVLEAVEGGGALLFVLAGLWPLAHGMPYMQNVLPLGRYGDLLSGGLMLVENAGVACAVAGGFGLLFLEFLEETRAPGHDEESEGPSP